MKNHKEDCFHLGVKGLILNPEKKILLLERNHPLKGKYWDIPGGRLQKGESLLETLAREIQEETGLDKITKIDPFMTVLTDIRIPNDESDVGLIFSIFLLNISEGFHPTLSNEHVSFMWCTPFEASEKLKPQYPRDFLEKLSLMKYS